MREAELRRAGRYLREHPPAEPSDVDDLRRRLATRRLRQRSAAAVVALLAIFGAGAALWTDGDREVIEATAGIEAGSSTSTSVPDEPPMPAGRGPSQSPEDAQRDGVHAAVAALRDRDRSDRLVSIRADEGYWTLSRGTARDALQVGDPDGRYGIDRVLLPEYGEILLLDEEGRIQRAYPMPGLVPTWIQVTRSYVYAGRVGDGGLPASSIVRIDRADLDAEVVVFPIGGQESIPELGWVTAPAEMAITDFVWQASSHTEVTSWTGSVEVDLDAIDLLLASLPASSGERDQMTGALATGQPLESAKDVAERFMNEWYGDPSVAMAAVDATDGRTQVTLETSTGAEVVAELRRTEDTYVLDQIQSPGLLLGQRSDGAYVTTPASGTLTIVGYSGSVEGPVKPGEVMVESRVESGINGPFHLVESSFLSVDVVADDGRVLRYLAAR